MNKTRSLFRLTAGLVAVYHTVYGLIGILASQELLVSISKTGFGLSLEMTPQFFIVAKILASFMLIFGLMMWLVVYDPERYSPLTWLAAIYFGINTVYRIAYNGPFIEEFQSTFWRSMLCVFFMVTSGTLLVYFAHKLQQSAGNLRARRSRR